MMLAGLSIATPAHAEHDDVEPIALDYQAIGACPSESEFVALVRKYTKRWSLVPGGTSTARIIRVRIAAKTPSVVGTLVVANASDAFSERELEGPSCKRVSDGLAVMVALAIDAPHSGPPSGPSKEDTSPPPLIARDETVVARDEPRDERADERQQDPPVSERPSATASSTPQRTTEQAGEGAELSLDVRMETSSAVLRGAVPGIGASAKIEPSSSASWLGRWKPSFGVGIRQSFPKEQALRGGSTEFSWTAANVRLCPLQFAVRGAVQVSPCAELDVGVLHASADGFSATKSLSTFWLDAGGSIWAAVYVSDRMFLSSTVLMTVPMNRQPFVFSSGKPIASVPPLVCFLGWE
ncbi:hypothetical protein AKJ09_02616 [Labilithrix luteola]|uniref:Uncharacterized protein n=1 Tax=Labilithrix luteola TaxID=1391654 RepID=A0A0K1PR02_9BACT|nr:hypothetical protein [Labilithrix luteola]AKU95952.1 hypothetical protein AKJ09_02616 [Labilithrix luteola]